MKGVSASERTVRSACFPGTSEPSVVVEPERARAAERRELERVGGGQRVRAALAGARADDRRAHLVEHVERRRRRGAVRRDADADARLAQRRERGDAAAEDPVRARAVRDRDVVLGEERDLLLVGLDAVRGDDVRAEQPASASARMPVVPGGGTSISANDSQRAGPRAQELRLGLALGEVRRDREAELAHAR